MDLTVVTLCLIQLLDAISKGGFSRGVGCGYWLFHNLDQVLQRCRQLVGPHRGGGKCLIKLWSTINLEGGFGR